MPAMGLGLLKLDNGDDIKIIFTNRALATAENRLNESILLTASKLSSGDVSVNTVVVLIKCGIEAANNLENINQRVTNDFVYQILDEVGFLAAVEIVVNAMTECLTYGTKE